MKTFEFARRHDLADLHDELVEAIPELRPVGDPSEARLLLSGDGKTLRAIVPDDVDEAAVERVVKAHTPKAAARRAGPDPVVEAIDAAKNLADLKEALKTLRGDGLL